MAEPNELMFSVEWYSSCLYELDGDAYDDQQGAEEIGPDFATLDEAAAWVRERAASDRLDVFVPLAEAGSVTRNVYIVTAMRYDADDGWVLCRLDGSDARHCGDECAIALDVLFDLHPEVFAAWEKSSRRRGCFDLFLEDEFGPDWRDLDCIQASFEAV